MIYSDRLKVHDRSLSMKLKTTRTKNTNPKSVVSKTSASKERVARSSIKSADATRTNILNVAMQEFSRNGLSGSRIDEIAAETGSNKRMIYYYFGSKEGLFLAALEESYKRFRALEMEFHLDHLPPMEALQKLVALTFDYHAAHPEFVRIVMTENIHMGEHIRQIPQIRSINKSAISPLEQLCQRGQADGVFRPDLDPIDLHMSISALSFDCVSNQHTFSYIFQKDLSSKAVHKARRESIVDMITRFVRA